MTNPTVKTRTVRDDFAGIVLGNPDSATLLGAMQVAMRRLDEFTDAHPDQDPYDSIGLNRWYTDAVEAYSRLLEGSDMS